jgi:hypothetical protein
VINISWNSTDSVNFVALFNDWFFLQQFDALCKAEVAFFISRTLINVSTQGGGGGGSMEAPPKEISPVVSGGV